MRQALFRFPGELIVCGLLILLAAAPPSAAASADAVIVRDARGVVLRTSQMTRVIRFSTGTPTAVIPSSFTVPGAGELFAPGADWFVLPADGRLWTNREAVWQFDGESRRPMTNGGTELRLRFTGVAAAQNLMWEYLVQVFPGSTLNREKIIFRAKAGSGMTLDPANGAPLLVFPAYRFRRDSVNRPDACVVSLARWGSDLVHRDTAISFDDRSLEVGTRVGKNLAQNYMYHPGELSYVLRHGDERSLPGPLLLLRGLARDRGLMFAYEHGAPDGDPEQEYLTLRQKNAREGLEVATVYGSGLYGRGTQLTVVHGVESVWNTLGVYLSSNPEGGKALFHEYLRDKITEASVTRIPRFYYNTWGMQRDEERKGADVRTVLTVDRVLKEIDLAKRLNVDIFVLDDGWQGRFGDWVPDVKRYPEGLRWYAEALTTRRMIPGIWIAPLASDPDADIAREHPEWLVCNDLGQPVVGRWEKHIFCFASGYRNAFIAKCKVLIDAGIRYFKWDGIDKHLCSSPLHLHGTSAQTPRERMQQQGYDLPLLVADAIHQLRTYCPDVVVEIDVTEPGRSLGLAILSEGKYFWMNNGAASYGDFSTHRAKSTRFIPNLYHAYMPLALLTYACYPHDNPVFSSRRANVNSAIIAGWGFWGNLTTVAAGDIDRAGSIVALAKRVLPSVAGLRPKVTGAVGGSPEVYELIDDERAVGQVIGFSGTAMECAVVRTGFRSDRMLAVLRNAFEVTNDTLRIPFVFPMPESSREAFVIPNDDTGINIMSSSSWLQSAEIIGGDTLTFVPGAPGRQRVRWDAMRGVPRVHADPSVRSQISRGHGHVHAGDPYMIEIESSLAGVRVRIAGER